MTSKMACEKHQKPVIVMEPVKGGNLFIFPAEADGILRSLNGGSSASYAICRVCEIFRLLNLVP